jgi:hypothetical protein
LWILSEGAHKQDSEEMGKGHRWAVNNDIFYYISYGGELMKLLKGEESSNELPTLLDSICDENLCDSSSMVYFKGKLYVRVKDSDKPLIIFDAETL